MNLFGQKPAHDPAVVGRLKGWAREMLGLGEDVAMTVMQLSCAEDGCPDVETVVGILEQGNQRKYKVFKPLAEVTREDLLAALGQPPG